MDTEAYPGKGLSLSQLVFALTEELKHPVHCPPLTLGDIRRLDRGALTALALIREWRNSFVRINRIPSEVLSLIPTHLESQKDRFRATFVCRHWRRTFLQYPALWSQLYLEKGGVYVKTILERAKGSALDIVAVSSAHVDVITLLSPRTKQIRSLDFSRHTWADILRFSELHSGPLSLLRTLKIDHDRDDAMITSSLLFSNAVDLREFKMSSKDSPFLNYFVFPNLASFQLSVEKVEQFQASQLLDFLEASPTLQKVDMMVIADILFDDVPRERAIVLPNLESFSLVVSDGGPGYDLVARMSCPSAKDTKLLHRKDINDMTLYNIFPAPASWDTIVRQCTRSPVEEVTLEIKQDLKSFRVLTCSLIFESPGATVLTLCFEVTTKNWNVNQARFHTSLDAIYCGVFSEACRIIRDLSLLANVKHLEIRNGIRVNRHVRVPGYTGVTPIANEVGRLFKSLGPLEELTLRRCDMEPYFNPSVLFPPIKKLTISRPLCPPRKGFEAAIVGLAKSQHALGVPFESVTVDKDDLSTEMEKGLGLWVGVVCCHKK